MAALPQVIRQLMGAIRGMSPGKRLTLLVLVLGTAAGLGFLMTWSGGVDLRTLYSGLDPQDAGTIVQRLKEQKIPYRISADGRTIMAPAESVHEVRMQFASEGLPQGGGIGFEVFDNTKLGMSEFAQNVNFQRALQGELARTITRINEVESCRVHLVMPEKTLFVDHEQLASASIAVKLKSGRRLSQEQINGIVHLVSSSVPRLAPDHVTVVDNSGKLLAGSKGKAAFGALSQDQLEYQSQVEKNLEGRVKSMLEQALGEGKAIVRLAGSFDFQRHEKTEEHYLPDNRVVRSEQSLSESSRNGDAAPQGVPGVRSNTPGPDLMQNQTAAGAGATSFDKQDRTVNYEIGKVTSRILEPIGKLTRVSVAVLVDGTYKTEAKKDGGTEREFIPRGAEEIQKIENLVKRAVGFDADRGDTVEVVNIPFEVSEWSKAETAGAPSGWAAILEQAVPYIKHGSIGLFLVLTFLFFVKPLVRWLTEPSMPEVEIVKQLPMRVGELEHELAGVKSLPSLNQASMLVANDSDASVGVMRHWLKDSAS
jgi:flagellar M-ring protein FliF